MTYTMSSMVMLLSAILVARITCKSNYRTFSAHKSFDVKQLITDLCDPIRNGGEDPTLLLPRQLRVAGKDAVLLRACTHTHREGRG